MPSEIKNIDSFAGFEQKIKSRKPDNFPCKPRKVYIQNVGFILKANRFCL